MKEEITYEGYIDDVKVVYSEPPTDFPSAEDYIKGISITEPTVMATPSTTGGYRFSPIRTSPPTVSGMLYPSSLPYGPGHYKADLWKVTQFCLDNDLWIRRTGSQVIEDLVPNDYDYIVEDPKGILAGWLQSNDFWLGGSARPEQEFMSWKKGDLNIIVTHDREYFRKYLMATELLKQLQPKTKEERISIFDAIFKTNKDTDVPF